MKCDKLQVRTIYVDWKGGEICYYDPYEVNEAVAELKAENERLKADLYKTDHHNIQFQCKMYGCDNVEAFLGEIKNLQTKLIATERALWLMTAEWAEAMGLASCNIAAKFMSRENFEVTDDYRQKTIKKYRHRQVVFCKYADYCRKKAEVA